METLLDWLMPIFSPAIREWLDAHPAERGCWVAWMARAFSESPVKATFRADLSVERIDLE